MRSPSVSRASLWTGRVLSWLPAAFLLLGSTMSLTKSETAVQGIVEMGYPSDVLVPLGIVQVACVLLYLFPPTAILGAIFLTGFLGGAVATHVRVGDPLATQGLIPVYFATALWLGLWLRRPALRSLVPIARD